VVCFKCSYLLTYSIKLLTYLLIYPEIFQRRIFGRWLVQDFFKGQMPFQSPKQWCQSRERHLLFFSLHFNGHFPGGYGLASTRLPTFWILMDLRVMEVLRITGAIRRAKLQAKMSPRTNQQLTIYTVGWKGKGIVWKKVAVLTLVLKRGGHFCPLNFCDVSPSVASPSGNGILSPASTLDG